MAIIAFNTSTFGSIIVRFFYNDANSQMTNCQVSKGAAGNVNIFVSDGVTTEEQQNAGFSLAPFGQVRVIEDELGQTVDFPEGLFFRIQVDKPAQLSGQQGPGPGNGR